MAFNHEVWDRPPLRSPLKKDPMSELTDYIEHVRSVLKDWDDGNISAAEFDSRMNDMYLDPILKCVESGEEFMRMGSCCCSHHPPDRKFTIEMIIQPHGFSIKRVND